ncbi:hypothetical protein BWQ96_09718 [Gracilariopsis chorda]|uniref:Peripheral subunit-binding (PSBD) domain-containing protein n=1 Tax=Gracilariopsis chorda TaxID=448386 RepID=A0A2V3IES4_9FLOR|nr:hypothetical protein BWQ96_09718 [Gracilariopsis chorda]|eukprot:PXF40563.1 hypothetical protein BWQ96_09718 [Gracilariopsis chorda]
MKVFFEDGAADVPVGIPVAVVVEEEEDIAAFKNYVPDEGTVEYTIEPHPSEPTPEPVPPIPVPSTPQTPQPSATPVAAAHTTTSRVVVLPLARVSAANASLPLISIIGTGSDGRVIAADVQVSLVHGVPEPAPAMPAQVPGMQLYTEVENTKFKWVTAERLLQFKQTLPQYY